MTSNPVKMAIESLEDVLSRVDEPKCEGRAIMWKADVTRLREALSALRSMTGEESPTPAKPMTQAHALDIIVRHLPDDGFTGVSRRWNSTARAIIHDLMAEGLELAISADEPFHAPPVDVA